MRIGFDIDGVLADFIRSYRELLVERTGVNHFPRGPFPWMSWDYDLELGYTPEQRKAMFKEIAESRSFWYLLKPTADCATLDMCIQSLEHEHDVYFITNRGGQYAKRQTEAWLKKHLTYPFGEISPTVLIAGDKGAACSALRLDAYIDDNLDNILGVLDQSPKTRAYLLDRDWNQGSIQLFALRPDGTFEKLEGTRVSSVGRFLDFEVGTESR